MRFGPTIAAVVFVLVVGVFAPVSPWLVLAALIATAAADRIIGRLRRRET